MVEPDAGATARPIKNQKIVALVHLTVQTYANHHALQSTSKESVPMPIAMLIMIQRAPSTALLELTTGSHFVPENSI